MFDDDQGIDALQQHGVPSRCHDSQSSRSSLPASCQYSHAARRTGRTAGNPRRTPPARTCPRSACDARTPACGAGTRTGTGPGMRNHTRAASRPDKRHYGRAYSWTPSGTGPGPAAGIATFRFLRMIAFRRSCRTARLGRRQVASADGVTLSAGQGWGERAHPRRSERVLARCRSVP